MNFNAHYLHYNHNTAEYYNDAACHLFMIRAHSQVRICVVIYFSLSHFANEKKGTNL
jgi:hypothetical protein